MSRPIYEIAKEIKREWIPTKKDHHFGYALPYINAMLEIDQITDNYYADSASSVVAYFLSNATFWKGEAARKIKAELNQMLKEHRNHVEDHHA